MRALTPKRRLKYRTSLSPPLGGVSSLRLAEARAKAKSLRDPRWGCQPLPQGTQANSGCGWREGGGLAWTLPWQPQASWAGLYPIPPSWLGGWGEGEGDKPVRCPGPGPRARGPGLGIFFNSARGAGSDFSLGHMEGPLKKGL